MAVTALYAALLTPLFILLSARVIGARRASSAALGDGGDPVLLRRMRVQANFAAVIAGGRLVHDGPLAGIAESIGYFKGVCDVTQQGRRKS